MSTGRFPGSGPAVGVLVLWVPVLALMGATLFDWHAGADGAAAEIQALLLRETLAPRLVVAALCGFALAASGVLMQALLRNPLASPQTLGAANGSQLLLSLAMLLAPEMLAHREALSIAGGAMALGLVHLLAWRQRMQAPTVALCGLVVSLFLGAINAALLVLQPQGLSVLFVWGAGSLVQDGWDQVAFLVPRVAVGVLALALLLRPMEVLDLGDAMAANLGLPVRALRLAGMTLALCLSAVTVACVGVIGFVGLGAPAIAGLLGARTLRQRLLWAPWLGAGLVLGVDLALQRLFGHDSGAPPTGAVIALLGAPLLLWLLRRMPPLNPLHAVEPDRVARTAPWRGATLVIVLLGCAAVLLALMFGPGPAGWHWSVDPDLLALRAPRAGAAAGAGAMLAVAGLLLQRATRNELASPELLGLGAGTAFGMLLAILLIPLAGAGRHVAAGAAGGVLTMAVLVAMMRRAVAAPERLLLVGVAITTLFDAVQVLALSSVDPRGPGLLGWLSGSTYFASADTAQLAILGGVLAMLAVSPLVRWLDMLPMGPVMLRALAVPVSGAYALVLAIAAALTIAATLVLGPLTFVGLLAPHAARMLGYRRARGQLAVAVLLGAITMVSADWLGRTVLYPMQVPAGLTASVLGGAYLLGLLGRRPRRVS